MRGTFYSVPLGSDSEEELKLRFGRAVKRFRNRLCISQEVLAELAELDRTYISHVERGARNVSLSTIQRLARALRVSPATLLSALDEKKVKVNASVLGEETWFSSQNPTPSSQG
jgi:transcriptional regulator with XRE-family HTH domain